MLATSWNCSKRLTGRKVRILYLEVLMQLLYSKKGEMLREAPFTPTPRARLGLPLPSSRTSCTHRLASNPGVGQGEEGGGGRKSLQAHVFCFSDRKPEKSALQQMEIGPKMMLPCLPPPSPPGTLPSATSLGLRSSNTLPPQLWEEGTLTAYWNFSLYSRSLARALRSSSAIE